MKTISFLFWKRGFLAAALLGLAGAAGAALVGGTLQTNRLALGGGASIGDTASYHMTSKTGQAAAGRGRATSSYGVRHGVIHSFGSSAGGGGTDPTQDALFTIGCHRIFVPAGTFSSRYTASLTVPSMPAGTTPEGAPMTGTSVGVQFDVTPAMGPQTPITYDLCYGDPDVAGLDESALSVARFLAGPDQWISGVTAVDAPGNRASLQTPKTGVFQLIAKAPATDVEHPRSHPNPFRPRLGHWHMTFTHLPAGAELRVYTPAGRWIRTLHADGAGQADWDVRNAEGAEVESGVYLGLLRSNGKNKVIRLGVER